MTKCSFADSAGQRSRRPVARAAKVVAVTTSSVLHRTCTALSCNSFAYNAVSCYFWVIKCQTVPHSASGRCKPQFVPRSHPRCTAATGSHSRPLMTGARPVHAVKPEHGSACMSILCLSEIQSRERTAMTRSETQAPPRCSLELLRLLEPISKLRAHSHTAACAQTAPF